jgi:hypothetical protein
MVIRNEHRPLLARQRYGALHYLAGRIDAFLGAGAAKHERPRIDRIGEQVMHRRISRRLPHDPPSPGRPARQQQPVTTQRQQHLPPGAQFSEAAEHVAIASTTASSEVITTAPVSS